MFGYSDTYIRRWFEPDLLASLRFLTVGQMAFHLVDPSELNKALKTSTTLKGKLDATVQKNLDSPSTLLALMNGLNDDILKAYGKLFGK